MVKTKLDTMCRTQKQWGNLVPSKRLNFRINLLNYKELKKMICHHQRIPYKVFVMAIDDSKMACFYKQNKFISAWEYQNYQIQKIYPIWKIKIWYMVVASKSKQNRVTAFDTH